ncbi:MAG: hypothetical protein WAM26_11725, partial [Nitrososphaeraceae archaeon]
SCDMQFRSLFVHQFRSLISRFDHPLGNPALGTFGIHTTAEKIHEIELTLMVIRVLECPRHHLNKYEN